MRLRGFVVATALFALAACRKEPPAPVTAQDAGPAKADLGARPSSLPALPVDAGEPPEPPKAMVLYREADASFQQGDVAKALSQAQAAVAADPSLPLAWNLLGRAAAKQFETTRQARHATAAREAYARAVKLDPNFLPAWQNLAELEERLGRPKQAAEAWARVLAIAPEHPDGERIRAFIEKAGGAR